MPYYGGQGDFYRGQGDPGVFDFLKKAAGTALGFISPFAKPAIAIGTGLVSYQRRAAAARGGVKPALGVPASWAAGGGRAMMLPPWKGRPMPSITAPYDESGRGRKGRYKMVRSPSGVPVGTWVAGGRRMNVANIKALRRAIRRMVGFQKVALSVFALLRGVALPTTKGRRAKCARCGRARCICRRALMPGRGDFYMGDGGS